MSLGVYIPIDKNKNDNFPLFLIIYKIDHPF